MVNLPKWALWWDNLYDGMWGDWRGWWNNETGDCRTFKSMWLWNGVRNPCNYFGRHIKGIDVSTCLVTQLAGNTEEVKEDPGLSNWHFLVAEDHRGRKYHRLFCVWAYKRWPDKSIQIDVGWKIKLKHNQVSSDAPPEDRFKSSVFYFSPWKSL